MSKWKFGDPFPDGLMFSVNASHMASKYDSDVHYITGSQLMKLYRIPISKCKTGMINENIIVVSPRYHGDYESHLEELINEYLEKKKQ